MLVVCGEPKFLRIDLTPSWYDSREARQELLPRAVALILQSKIAGMRREIRLHLEGIEIEVLNVTVHREEPFDVNAECRVLRERIAQLLPQ